MRNAALLLTLLLAAGLANAQEFLDCHLVPGWEQYGPKRQYDSETLFDYEDGGSAGYLVYGFAHMNGITCKSGANTLLIDISEMTDEDAAYGIFTDNLNPAQPIAQIGMGGQILPRNATFAKGKYYVELSESGASPDANDAATLRAFVADIAVRLQGRTTPPEPLQWFLPESIAPPMMIPESVLGLRQLKRGYVAKYKQGQAFIVLETSPDSAALAFKALRDRFAGASPASIGDEAFQANAQYLVGICIFRKGRILAGYANLPDPQQAVSQAAKLAVRIP